MTAGGADGLSGLREDSREAAQMLGVLVFMAPEPAPVWLFAEQHAELPDPLAGAARAGSSALMEPVRELEERGLVEVDGPRLHVPAETAERVRERMTSSEKGEYGGTAVRLLHEAFPDRVGRPEDRERSRELAPHLLAAAGWPEGGGRTTAEAVHMLARLGSFFRSEGETEAARDAFRRALEVAERGTPVEGPLRAVLCDELASTEVALGDLDAARSAAGRALELAEASLPTDAPQLPILLSNVGTTFREAGDAERAASCFRRALELAEEAGSGAARPLVAELHLSLADVRMLQERFGAASEAAGRSLGVAEEVWGEVHPHTARSSWILADARRALGEGRRAAELYRRSLEIQERLQGPDHPSVGQKAMALGLHLDDLGEAEEARRCLERAMEVFSGSLGPESDAVSSVRACLERVGERASS